MRTSENEAAWIESGPVYGQAAGMARMSAAVVEHTVLEPWTQLRPFVKRFEVVRSLTERAHTLLPDTSLVACLRLDGTAMLHGGQALPTAILSGLQDRARMLTHLPGSLVLLTIFSEAGAAAFLREPVDLLFNETMPMDSLLRRSQLDDLHSQAAEAAGPARRVEAMQRFLLGRLQIAAPDPLATAVAAEIRKRHGAVRVEELSRAAGLSLSALERRFRKQVGASPRKFASIARLRHVLRLRKTGGNLTEIAYQAGYADQSHFIKDFSAFTGVAPGSFFQRRSSFC